MIRFCMTDCAVFTYDGLLYKQIYGTAMGSPLSATLANIVMDDLVETCLQTSELDVRFVLKYVDDFCIAVRREHTDELLRIFSDYDHRIKLTCEREHEMSLCFPDTRVHRVGEALVTDWYSKPTASNRMVNFLSYHSYHVKLNTAYGLIRIVLSIADQRFHTDRINDIRRILTMNNFP